MTLRYDVVAAWIWVESQAGSTLDPIRHVGTLPYVVCIKAEIGPEGNEVGSNIPNMPSFQPKSSLLSDWEHIEVRMSRAQ